MSTMPRNTVEANHLHVRDEWLKQWIEPVIEPDMPIVDPHHHLWLRKGWPYQLTDLLGDLTESGHRVVSTLFVECRTHYYGHGAPEYRSVGEVAFAAECGRLADQQAQGGPRVCEGVIGHADLRSGAGIAPVLDALEVAGQGRLRGIRHSVAWDAEPEIYNPELGSSPGMTGEKPFRDAVDLLGRRGLVYDIWLYHPQLPVLVDLAQACPDTQFVLDHAGGPVGIGRYRSRRGEAFREWRKAICEVAKLPNVAVKLGGLTMRISGMDFHSAHTPPDSARIAQVYKPYVDVCLEAFGANRCMFESNFPVDKASCSYRVLWNAYKRVARQLSAEEKAALFHGTATRIYGLAALPNGE